MKFFIYAITIMGMMILLTAAGMQLPSTTLVKTLNIFDSNGDITFSNFKSSTLWTSLIGILAGTLVATILIGSFTRSAPESFIVGATVLTITGLITGDIISIYQQLSSYDVVWIKWAALAILAPLTFGLYISAIDYWRGGDA